LQWGGYWMNEQKNKTVVVKMEGKWQFISVEAGRIFTGPDHNRKAIKYFDKKTQEKTILLKGEEI
jgi:hypothetical protein